MGYITGETSWATRAAEWFALQWKSTDLSTANCGTVFHLLLGILLLARLDGPKVRATLLKEMLGYVAEVWRSNPRRVRDETDPLVIAQVYLELERLGISVSVVGQLVQELHDSVLRIPEDMWQRPKIWLLGRLLGVWPDRALERASSLLVTGPDFLFLDANGIQEQCNLWMALTNVGRSQVHPVFEQHVRALQDVLPSTLLAECQKYHLEAAADLLRTMVYLDLPCDDDLREGVEFLLMQQRRDGSFGFVNPIGSRHQQSLPNRLVGIHLPWSLAATWALVDVFGCPTLTRVCSRLRVPVYAPSISSTHAGAE